MISSDFSSAVSVWSARTRQRMETVFRASAQMLAEEIVERTPVADGGLLASFRASASPIAMMQADAGDFEGNDIARTSASLPPGGIIRMGFAAPYAAEVEYGAGGVVGHGMLRLAAQNWTGIVGRAIRETR